MSDPQATYSVDADGQVQTNYDQASTDGQVPTPKSDEQVPPGYGQTPTGYGPPQAGYDQPPPYSKEATLEEQMKQSDNQAPPGYQGQPMAYPQQATVYTMQGGTPVVVASQPVTDRTILVRREPLVNRPPDYLLCSILVCFFCCWPLGIYAIILSCGSRDSANLGDEVAAKYKGMKARNVIIAALVIGLILNAFVVGFNVYNVTNN